MKGGKMEQVIPIEECAKQRLQALVYAYSLLIKNLREEGVDREIVFSVECGTVPDAVKSYEYLSRYF